MPRRSIDELLATDDPAWPLLGEWIRAAVNRVEVIASGPGAAADLHLLQVTARSTLGAVVYHTGGMLIDGGWVRVLGSRSERLARSLIEWNAACGIDLEPGAPPLLLVADDV